MNALKGQEEEEEGPREEAPKERQYKMRLDMMITLRMGQLTGVNSHTEVRRKEEESL